MYTSAPSETPLRHRDEPYPERYYFRKTHPGPDGASARRQVGILPVFATRVPWVDVKGSYPAIGPKDSLIFDLEEVDEYLYHGILLLGVPPNLSRGGSAVFGVHFLVAFGRENNRPRFWGATAVDDLQGKSADDLQSITESVTKSIKEKAFPVAHPVASHTAAPNAAGDSYPIAPNHSRKKDPGLVVANHKDSDAFAKMDNRWYAFKSSGLEETSFETHINLVLFGVHKGTPTPSSSGPGYSSTWKV